jgi:hypothetical protein
VQRGFAEDAARNYDVAEIRAERGGF